MLQPAARVGRRLALPLLVVSLLGSSLTASPAGAQGSLNPVLFAAARTALAGSVAFAAHVELRARAHGATLLVSSLGTLSGRGLRALVAVRRPRHAASRAELRLVASGRRPVLFIAVPRLVRLLPPGKRWLRLPLSEALGTLGAGAGSLGSAAGLDPSSLLRLLGSLTVTPRRVGPTLIGGHLTERYDIAIGPGLLRRSLGLPAGLPLGLARLKPLALAAWVDERDGFIRQLRIAFRGGGAAPPELSLVLQLHDFGHPFPVAAPPAASTLGLAALAPALLHR